MKILIDTNVFVRFAVADDLQKAEDCKQLINLCGSGKYQPYVSFISLFEITFLLQKSYGFTKQKTIEFIDDVLKTRNLTVIKIIEVTKILNVFRKESISFADAVIFFQMEKDLTLCTYDKKLSSIVKSSKTPDQLI